MKIRLVVSEPIVSSVFISNWRITDLKVKSAVNSTDTYKIYSITSEKHYNNIM